MPSFRPLRLRVSATTCEGLLLASYGSPGRICQWSNMHWGKAWPPVLDLRSAVKPAKESSMIFYIKRLKEKYVTNPFKIYWILHVEHFNSRCIYFEDKHTKWFIYRKICLHNKYRCSCHLRLFKHVASFPVQDTVDTTDSLLWTLKGT